MPEESKKRKSISKKLRFEVFKRDEFACQYCGATPPKVVLHIDHIHPVAEGGKNNIDNLITACECCNQGKGARLLSSVPESLADKAAKQKEREEQIKQYNKILLDKAKRIESEAWYVAEVIEDAERLDSYSKIDFQSIKTFLEKLPFAEVIDAAQKASARGISSDAKRFRYFCGICWNKIREQ